jgi:lysozyme
MKNIKFPNIVTVILLSNALLILFSCSSYHNIRYNYISFNVHPIQGLDVSHHQGDIDWKKVSNSKFSFVFMKATEGADFVDKKFASNFREAEQSGMIVGAYHFFSFKSSGEDQANNFINTVPYKSGMLPPVIDLEYMGHSRREDSYEKLHRELEIYIRIIEKSYNIKPILYTNYAFFNRYLVNKYMDYWIWIADYSDKPRLRDNRPWLFWQYSDRGKVSGIKGNVDFNVFNGKLDDLNSILTD